jgi:hypothetical protein
MQVRRVNLGRAFLALVILLGCRDNSRNDSGSSRASLPPVFSLGPASSTNWDVNAGPVMLVSLGGGFDSAAVVLPEVTDSTMEEVQGIVPPLSGLVFELFSRDGDVGSSTAASLPTTASTPRDCYAWPAARVQSARTNWRVGLVRGNAKVVALDSIGSLSSADSATLAASLAQSAATLPASADPVFVRLPFRVRSAYTFRLDSSQVVIADVVRSLNEEANPRIEDLFLIGERPIGATGKYTVGYFNRIAGAEETIQATEVLTVLEIGELRRPAVIVNVETEDGSQLGFIERTGPGQWRYTWKSAYTDC